MQRHKQPFTHQAIQPMSPPQYGFITTTVWLYMIQQTLAGYVVSHISALIRRHACLCLGAFQLGGVGLLSNTGRSSAAACINATLQPHSSSTAAAKEAAPCEWQCARHAGMTQCGQAEA